MARRMVAISLQTHGFADMESRLGYLTDRGIKEHMRSVMAPVMTELRDAVRAEVPGSGRLQRNVHYKLDVQPSGGEAAVKDTVWLERPGAPYPNELWNYIIQGTRPHPIVARRVKFLHFYWPKMGGWVFFKRVMHPGTAPNDIIANAWQNSQGDAILDRAAMKIGNLIIAELR